MRKILRNGTGWRELPRGMSKRNWKRSKGKWSKSRWKPRKVIPDIWVLMPPVSSKLTGNMENTPFLILKFRHFQSLRNPYFLFGVIEVMLYRYTVAELCLSNFLPDKQIVLIILWKKYIELCVVLQCF